MSCITLLPTCSTPKIATRTGLTGAFAYINGMPDLNIWFASGAQFNYAPYQAAQDQSRTYTGTVKPNTFQKGFACAVPADCVAANPFGV